MKPDLKLFKVYDQITQMVNESVPDAVEALALDAEGLARMLKRHDDMITVLQLAREEITQKLQPMIPFGSGLAVDGVGVVQVKGGRKRTRYDQPRVVSSIARQLAYQLEPEVQGVDPSTGETRPPITTPELVEEVCNTMAQATGAMAPSFSSWRTGVLKRLDLDPDDFCESEAGPTSVIILAP